MLTASMTRVTSRQRPRPKSRELGRPAEPDAALHLISVRAPAVMPIPIARTPPRTQMDMARGGPLGFHPRQILSVLSRKLLPVRSASSVSPPSSGTTRSVASVRSALSSGSSWQRDCTGIRLCWSVLDGLASGVASCTTFRWPAPRRTATSSDGNDRCSRTRKIASLSQFPHRPPMRSRRWPRD